MSDINQQTDHGLLVEEAKPELKRPSLHRVVLLNDDYTPMEFVVEILETLFYMDRNKATRIMLEVHDGALVLGPGIVAYAQANFPPAGQIGPGQTWYFQGWYRDPAGPCGSGFNLTNGIEVTFTP